MCFRTTTNVSAPHPLFISPRFRACCFDQECFPEGYTPVTASTAVALGNLLIKQGTETDAHGASESTMAGGGGHQARDVRVLCVLCGRMTGNSGTAV